MLNLYKTQLSNKFYNNDIRKYSLWAINVASLIGILYTTLYYIYICIYTHIIPSFCALCRKLHCFSQFSHICFATQQCCTIALGALKQSCSQAYLSSISRRINLYNMWTSNANWNLDNALAVNAAQNANQFAQLMPAQARRARQGNREKEIEKRGKGGQQHAH